MMLINNHKAAPMPLSQFHAKPNKEEILGAFVIIRSSGSIKILISYMYDSYPTLRIRSRFPSN